MAADEPRTLLWEAMTDADYRSRYFCDLATRYRRLYSVLTFSVAVLTSGALGTVLAGQPTAASLCSLLAAALSWWLFASNPSESVRAAALISTRWGEIFRDYEMLWAQQGTLTDSKILARRRKASERQKALDEMAASKFSYDRRLARRAYREMLEAHNIDSTETAPSAETDASA